MNKPVETPWGRADYHRPIAEGIDFFETPGHGGFRVSMDRWAKIREKFPKFVPFGCDDNHNFSRATRVWLEEDCDWTVLAFTFPDLFEKQMESARKMVAAMANSDTKWAEVNRIVTA